MCIQYRYLALTALVTAVIGIGPASALPTGTFVGKVDGSEMRRIAGPTEVAWFPDGERLLLAAGNALYRIALDGSGKTRVCCDPQVTDIWRTKVDPGGVYVAATVTRKQKTARDYDVDRLRVWDMNSASMLLDEAIGLFEGGGFFDFGWSCFSARLAWALSDIGPEPNDYVRLFGVAERRVLTLTSDLGATYLAWHPRREVILVTTHDGDLLLLDPKMPVGQFSVLTSDLPEGELGGNGVFYGLPRQFTWFASADALFLPSGSYAGVFGASGVSLGPSFSSDVVCLWTSQTDDTFIIGQQLDEETGEARQGPQGTLIARYKIGGTVRSGQALAVLPCQLQYVRVSPDGARIAFAVPGPEGLHKPVME
jgi:hypothetical protein